MTHPRVAGRKGGRRGQEWKEGKGRRGEEREGIKREVKREGGEERLEKGAGIKGRKRGR